MYCLLLTDDREDSVDYNKTIMKIERRFAMDNAKAWEYAIGIVQLDGIKPSDDFMELVEKEKKGEIKGEDIRKVLCKKYKVVERKP